MTIQEAINSGVRFERKGFTAQLEVNNGCSPAVIINCETKNIAILTKEDLLATDWEIKQEPKEYLICLKCQCVLEYTSSVQKSVCSCGTMKIVRDGIEVKS